MGASRSIVFSSRFTWARISLSCERALSCSGRRLVCANGSPVSVGAQRRAPALPVWGETPGCSATARHLCFWRAFGLSAQAEEDTPILCSSQKPVVHSAHAAHAAGAPLAAHSAPNRAGRASRALPYVPRGVKLDKSPSEGKWKLVVGGPACVPESLAVCRK